MTVGGCEDAIKAVGALNQLSFDGNQLKVLQLYLLFLLSFCVDTNQMHDYLHCIFTDSHHEDGRWQVRDQHVQHSPEQ